MSTTYAGTATFPASITIPSDGDTRDAASVNVGAEGLADRTVYLKQKTDVDGVLSIRSAANTAAMSALTGMANGELCLVKGTGLYYFASGSAATVDAWLVFTAVGGRWILDSASFANTSPGFAAIGVAGASANRIPASVVPNRVSQLHTNATTSYNFGSIYPGPVTIISQSVTLAAGDTVLFHHTGQLSCPIATGVIGRIRFWLDAATPIASRYSPYSVSGEPELDCSCHFAYTAPGAETLAFKVQAEVSAADGADPFLYVYDSLTAMVIRP